MMNLLSQFWRRLLSLLRRGRYEREMEEEMRFHLEMQIEQNLAAGIPAEEARYAARRQFGNQTWLKEVSREMWSFRFIETLIQDLRYGARRLMRNPGFTLIAVITLALGIGATTAIFSVVNGVLLKPLPYHQPEALASVRLTAQRLSVKDWALSASNYFIFREQSDAFQDIGLYQGNSVDVTGLGEPERTLALVVTDGLLPILGVTPLLGRSFTREDDFARQRGDGDPDLRLLEPQVRRRTLRDRKNYRSEWQTGHDHRRIAGGLSFSGPGRPGHASAPEIKSRADLLGRLRLPGDCPPQAGRNDGAGQHRCGAHATYREQKFPHIAGLPPQIV
ncbi:MAG TPA: permease prefix domain 1-containing protein [Blastocatellia bacterium]|nr:permease prefix domain 1-containing protein [Blastocatellia bacterium]